MKCRVPERMNDQRRWEALRASTSTMCCYAIMIALNQNMGLGATRQRRVLSNMERVQIDYAETTRSLNGKPEIEKARRILQEQVEGYAATTMDWPAIITAETPRKEWPRLQAEQDVRNDVATLCWCLYARCVREELHWGRKRFDRLQENAVRNLEQMIRYENEAGTDYMMTTIQRAIAKIVPDEEPELTEVTEEEMKSRSHNFAQACQKKAAVRRMNAAYEKLVADKQEKPGFAVLSPQQREKDRRELGARLDRALKACGLERVVQEDGKREG